MKIAIHNTIDAWYEWEPTPEDEARATGLLGKPLNEVESLSLGELCDLIFPDVSGLSGGEQLSLLLPIPVIKSRPSTMRSSRRPPGRIGYGA